MQRGAKLYETARPNIAPLRNAESEGTGSPVYAISTSRPCPHCGAARLRTWNSLLELHPKKNSSGRAWNARRTLFRGARVDLELQEVARTEVRLRARSSGVPLMTLLGLPASKLTSSLGPNQCHGWHPREAPREKVAKRHRDAPRPSVFDDRGLQFAVSSSISLNRAERVEDETSYSLRQNSQVR